MKKLIDKPFVCDEELDEVVGGASDTQDPPGQLSTNPGCGAGLIRGKTLNPSPPCLTGGDTQA